MTKLSSVRYPSGVGKPRTVNLAVIKTIHVHLHWAAGNTVIPHGR